jgi:hypothetical protein
MSERDILIRALRASGSEREAQLAEAILPAPPAEPAAPPTPAAPAAPAEVQTGPQPLQTIDEWEALPQKEQLARMGELDVLLGRGAK